MTNHLSPFPLAGGKDDIPCPLPTFVQQERIQSEKSNPFEYQY